MNKIVILAMVVLMSYVSGILTQIVYNNACSIRQKKKEILDAKENRVKMLVERCLEGYWEDGNSGSTNRIHFINYKYKPSYEERIVKLERCIKYLMQKDGNKSLSRILEE